MHDHGQRQGCGRRRRNAVQSARGDRIVLIRLRASAGRGDQQHGRARRAATGDRRRLLLQLRHDGPSRNITSQRSSGAAWSRPAPRRRGHGAAPPPQHRQGIHGDRDPVTRGILARAPSTTMRTVRYLVTSALPYINGVKHLGNLVGSMLPADVYARYLRQRGHDVLVICATDEHGTPAELAAAEAGLDVAVYCAQQHQIQADLAVRYGLSFDHFGRSSSPQNAELTRRFAERLRDNGLIEERVTEQVYSLDDQ